MLCGRCVTSDLPLHYHISNLNLKVNYKGLTERDRELNWTDQSLAMQCFVLYLNGPEDSAVAKEGGGDVGSTVINGSPMTNE